MPNRIPIRIREQGKAYATCQGPIRTPEDVARAIRGFIGDDKREYFLVLHLNTRHYVETIHVISIGSLDCSIVHPREVFRLAVMNATARIMLAHNHPSGNQEPSEDDMDITRRLDQAGELLGITVLDHIIVGTGCYSFKENGKL